MVKIYKQPFAYDGDAIAIPDASQPDGKMSSTDGWTPDYQLPKTDPNYKPVGRQEMNGVFKEVTEALGQMQVQGAASWSPDGAPYPINAQVYHNGKRWLALRANSVEPAEGEDWTKFSIEPGPDHYSLFSINNELIWRPTQRFLTADLTLYISPTGDDANLGTDKTNPKKTLEAALEYLRHIDSAGHTVSIVALPGTHGEDGDIRILDLSFLPFGTVIRSESDNPKDTVFRGRLFCEHGGTLAIMGIGLQFNNTAGANLDDPVVLHVNNGGTVTVMNCEITNTAGGMCVYCAGSLTNIYGTCVVTVPGDAHSAFYANIGGIIHFSASMTITGNYTTATMALEDMSLFTFNPATTITGPSTGKRYSVIGNSLINTRGAGTNYIPGSIAGTTASGGEYV